ncbi:MAG: hypothetical protein ACLTI1_01460 [Clostridia bacterium]
MVAGSFSLIPLPNFKPVGAIIIITALAFYPGRISDRSTGGNLKQLSVRAGIWTPWQMFCWGQLDFWLVSSVVPDFSPVGQTPANEKGKRRNQLHYVSTDF